VLQEPVAVVADRDITVVIHTDKVDEAVQVLLL
jgi:hypothetical protein